MTIGHCDDCGAALECMPMGGSLHDFECPMCRPENFDQPKTLKKLAQIERAVDHQMACLQRDKIEGSEPESIWPDKTTPEFERGKLHVLQILKQRIEQLNAK